MIECPNIAFVKDKVYFIYCPEYNDKTLAKNKGLSLDVYWYSKIDLDELLSSREFNKKNRKLSYGWLWFGILCSSGIKDEQWILYHWLTWYSFKCRI